MKKNHSFFLKLCSILALMVTLLLAACDSKKNLNKQNLEEKKVIKIGFSQVGSESDWREANTKSFRETFTKEKGYDLIFRDADCQSENQIEAIREFIEKKVDYIVFSPVIENGWEDILTEAKNANIPVILTDRTIKVTDNSLYTCWIGANFLKESQDAVAWLDKYLEKTNRIFDRMNIVNLQGTIGSSAQKGRSKGIEDGIALHENWHLVARETGEFNQGAGYETMSKIINHIGIDEIDAVFAENDDMAWGAIEAIQENGKVPGKDIIIISFDAVKETFERILSGEINCVAECNPLHGPRVEEIIIALENGKPIDKVQYVQESMFDITNARENLPLRSY